MLAAARLAPATWIRRFGAPRLAYRRSYPVFSLRVLSVARTYSTEKARRELVTDESSALPTLEAIDAIVASDQESARMAHASENKRWSTTFRRVNSSFTRPQLLELAHEAQLMGIKRTLSKSDIVRAFLEQRFNMRDPGVEHSPNEQHPTSRKLRVADYEAFFLMQSEQLLERASSSNVQVKLGKLDRMTPVVLDGPRAGVLRVYEQLQGVRQSIKQHMVDLAPSATGTGKKMQPESLTDALMRHISLISRCYVGNSKGRLCVWYTNAARLQLACSLIYQALDLMYPRIRPLFVHGGSPDSTLVLVPHSATSSALSVLSRGALRHTHARWTRGPSEDAPVFHGYRQGLETALHAAQKQLALDEAALPETLRVGPYTQLQHTTFGHLLWPTESLCTAQLQREVLHQCAPKKRNSQSHALFLPSLPPSCIASEVDLGYEWDYVSDESTDSIRLTYRLAAGSDSLLEVWLRPTERPNDAAMQGLLPDATNPEASSDVDQGHFSIQSARWIHRQEVDILHPDWYAVTMLPLKPLTNSATDLRFALLSEAPAVLQPLQATELGTYIATLREPIPSGTVAHPRAPPPLVHSGSPSPPPVLSVPVGQDSVLELQLCSAERIERSAHEFRRAGEHVTLALDSYTRDGMGGYARSLQAWWQGAALGPHPAVRALLTDPYPALGADTRRARI